MKKLLKSKKFLTELESSIITFLAGAAVVIDPLITGQMKWEKATLVALGVTALRAGIKAVWVNVLVPKLKK